MNDPVPVAYAVYKITSRPRRPINQLGDLKTNLDDLLSDRPKIFAIQEYVISTKVNCQMCTEHIIRSRPILKFWSGTTDYLNKLLNSDRSTQPSSIGGPLGDR